MNMLINLKKRLSFVRMIAVANRLLRGYFRYLTFLLALLGLLLIGESFFGVPAEWRQSIAATLLYAVFVPLAAVFIFNLIGFFDSLQAALEIERDSGMFDGYLASAVQLEADLKDPRLGYSQEMVAQLQARVIQKLQVTKAGKLIRWEGLRDQFFILLVAVMISLSFVGIAPGFFSLTFDKYWHPQRTQPIILATKFVVKPGTLHILTGEDVELRVRVLGEPAEKVFVKYRYFGGDWLVESLQKRKDAHHVYNFRSLLQSLEYYVYSTKARSPLYTINVRHEPKIVNQTISFDYPAYSGMKNRRTSETEGAIEALYGTKITIGATANKPLDSARLVFEKAAAREIKKIDKASLEVSFTAKHNDKSYFSIKDKEGLTNKNPVITPIIVYPDQNPQITLVKPADDVDLDESMTLVVVVKASDDFGIDRLELIAQRTEGRETVVPLVDYSTVVKKSEEEYLWDLSPLLHFPGDSLTFVAAVWDNDQIKGSKRGLSARFRVRLPTMGEIFSEVKNEQELQETGLHSILEQQRYIKEKAMSIYDSLKREKSLNWTQKKELEEIVRRQEDIKKQMERIIHEMSKTIDNMSQKRVVKFSTIEKLKEIRQLFEETLTSEMKETLNKLNQAIKNINLTEKQKELLQAKFNAEAFEKRVERTLKLLKQMKNKQELDSLIRENQSIMKEQRRIEKDTMKLDAEKNEKMKKQFAEELARRERKLAEQLKKLKEKTEELAKEMEETNPQAAQMLKDAIEQLEQDKVAQKMEEAAKSLQKKEFSKALKTEEQSLFGLFFFSKQLNLASSTIDVEEQEGLLAAFEELINDSFYLSFAQEGFIERLEGINRQMAVELTKTELSQIAKRESFLSENGRKIIDKMQQVAEMTPRLNYNLIFLLSAAVQSMVDSVEQLEQKRVSASLKLSKEALTSINVLIAALMRQYRQLSDSQGGQGGGMSDSLENLSQQQQGMNDITQMLAEKLMRGESLMPQEEELLQQLAFEQSVVGEEVRSLMEEMQRLGELLGQLGEAAKDSDEVSRNLKQKKLGQEILKKQRRILTRLLDAQRSRHRQDKEKRRQAERPKGFMAAPSPPPLDLPKAAAAKGEIIPLNPARNIPAPYKSLVQEYFRRLSTEQ